MENYRQPNNLKWPRPTRVSILYLSDIICDSKRYTNNRVWFMISCPEPCVSHQLTLNHISLKYNREDLERISNIISNTGLRRIYSIQRVHWAQFITHNSMRATWFWCKVRWISEPFDTLDVFKKQLFLILKNFSVILLVYRRVFHGQTAFL